MDFKKIVKENLRVDFSESLLNDIKTGLFIGVTVSSIVGILFRFFHISNVLIILILYIYPITGFLTAYFVSKNKKEKIMIQKGYHG